MNKTLKTIRLFFLLGTILLVPACLIIDDDDLNQRCTSDCTTIQGRFTTEDGKPIKNVSLGLDWTKYVMFGGNVRKIMTRKTDENGDYKFVFYAREKELSEGSFTVNFKLPDNSYITPGIDTYFEFYGINKRDTTIIGNCHIPKRGGKITLKLINVPDNTLMEDRTMSSVSYKFGLNQCWEMGTGELYSDKSSQVTLETAANQYTYIRTTKRRSSGYISLIDSVFIPINETKVYEIEF